MALQLTRVLQLSVLLVGISQALGASEIVPLPQVNVTESRILPPVERWRFAAVRDFEILSNASERETTHFVSNFVQLQQAVRIAWPALVSLEPQVPTYLLLCKSGNTLPALLSNRNGNTAQDTPSIFLRGTDRVFIAVDFIPSQTVRDSSENPDLIDLNRETGRYYDPFREVYRQYFRLILRNTGKVPPPLWLEEGLAQLLAGLEFNNKYVVFGRIGDRPDDFNRALEQKGFIPLGQMFTADSPPPGYARIWASQCNAFVHLGLFGMGQKYRANFIRFASLAYRQPVTEEMFKTCFGVSYKEMQLRLRGYVQHTVHGYIEKSTADSAQLLSEAPPFIVREASQGEVGRIKGEALATAGNVSEAREVFSAAYARDPQDAQLVGALGLFEQRTGSAERARTLLETAVKEKVPRLSLFLELARLNFDRARAQQQPGNSDGKQFSATQVSTILNPLFTARQLHLASPELYDLVAETWLRSAITPRADNLAILDEGIREYPNHANLVYTTARLYWEIGDKAAVEQLIRLGTKLAASDPQLRAKLLTLRDLMNSIAPAANPPMRRTTPADGP